MEVIKRIISGGQSGADLGGLEIAKKLGIETGGTAPKGYRTEDGRNMDLKRIYGLSEHISPQYPPRTEQNVKDSHMTIIFMPIRSSGSGLTIKLARKYRKDRLIIYNVMPNKSLYINENAKAIINLRYKMGRPLIINIAGNRESSYPGIRVLVKKYLKNLFKEIERRSDGD